MSVARPFSSIMGDMDVDQALARLGISRTQLQEQTSRMRQFLSSDATFAPMPGSRVFAQHASQPSLPTFPSAGAASGAALARSRSLDSSAGFASASAGPSSGAPHETPSRTRKADASEAFDERDSKRRRGEKTARAKNASGGSDPARRLYTTEPIPPYPAGTSAVQQDVFYSSHTSPVASSSRTPSVDRTRPPAPNQQLSVADVRAAGVSPPSSSSHQPPGSGASSSATSSQGAHTPQSQQLNGAALLLRYPLPPGFAWQQFEPKMPFHLPPGPRSEEKPSLPYAALIGQALLAAYFRRLPLHDITTYITLVHPYYKRTDTTWQNSLRHNLSTNDSFQRVDRHPDDHLTHGPCWMITPGHEKFFVGGLYCKPRNSPTKPKRDVVPDPVVQVQVKQEPVPIQIAGPSFPPHPSAAKYYRDRAPSTAAPPLAPAPVFAAPTPAYVAPAPAPTFNANYYRETTWKGSGAIPVYPPPGHALVTAYMPASLPRPAFRSAPPVIASSSPAPTPGAHQREYTLDPVQRLRALLDADSDSDETPSPEKPAHVRSISAGSSASLMDRKLLGAAPTSPITVSLMERTLERKALLMAQRGNPVEEEDEPELTPSPVAAAVSLPPEEDEATQELPEDFAIDPEIVTGEAAAGNAEVLHAHDDADAQPVQVDEEPEAYDPALTLDEAFDTERPMTHADVEDDADEQDDSGYRSSNSSPGVPLALLLTKRKNDKQRQDLSAAFTFSMPPQSPMSDLRSTARNNIRKKAKRKGAKGGAKPKKKKVMPAPAEADEEQAAAAEPEDEGQELVVPQRFATPPPLPQSSPTFPRSPFRTPLTSRNTGGEFGAGSPVRRDMYSTPKRPFLYSPLKTPAPTEDPFNAAAELERTLDDLPQCSPMRDRPWGGHAMSPGYLYPDFY